jgi:hypothetical protein
MIVYELKSAADCSWLAVPPEGGEKCEGVFHHIFIVWLILDF